jgi:hypothetical protein
MRRSLYSAVVLCAFPRLAAAGMPSVQLSDVANLRLETISFFLMLFLASAGLIQLLWNQLQRDWTFLPRLRYTAALGLVTLWGLLFVLVLTMISGARELMTPGAWERNGATYRLADQKKPSVADEERAAQQRLDRRAHLERLRDALWNYAFRHEGKFPSSAESDPAIPALLWRVPDLSAALYVYVGGARSEHRVPVAYEPGIFGQQRYVLYANGDMVLADIDQILRDLPPEKP